MLTNFRILVCHVVDFGKSDLNIGVVVGVIEEFLSEYERQFDYWEATASKAHRLLEAALASSGLRAIVTSRAKSADRLADKVRSRDQRTPYRRISDARDDIVDLAGVRVALYFPGQIDEAERVIRATLDVQSVKRFPARPQKPPKNDMSQGLGATTSMALGSHEKRFSGYAARHFRVRIPETRLGPGEGRYAPALIEIQVASVLMHAWSEVEHDLVYKPLEGELSHSEYALLDQLNGLVLAGEIALEQLQKAGDARVAAAPTPFRDHYELAEFLRSRLAEQDVDLTDATLGEVDVLFDFLQQQGLATSAAVEEQLGLLEQDLEHRPVAAQLADLMLSGDKSRYEAYLGSAATSRYLAQWGSTPVKDLKAQPQALAIGEFITTWVLFETLLRALIPTGNDRVRPFPILLRELANRKLITSEQLADLDAIRELRNEVVHGRASDASPEHLRQATERLRQLMATIKRSAGEH